MAHLRQSVWGGEVSTKWTATKGRGKAKAVFDGERYVGCIVSFSPGDLATALAAPEMLALLREEPGDDDALIEHIERREALLARIDGAK